MPTRSQPPFLEWVAGTLGFVVFAGLITVMATSALQQDRPPQLSASVTDIHHSTDGHVVEFVARNKGAATAAALELKATLTVNGAVLEERSTQIDYLPPRSMKRGGFIFQNDPRLGEVTIEPGGYVDP